MRTLKHSNLRITTNHHKILSLTKNENDNHTQNKHDKKKQVIRELERMCAEELPEYVQPVAYKFISSMPMTPVGKVDYRQLEADISPRDY
jgi:acyl-CoA synthetase (AMP-forming)/AMP-acid ligase II